MVFNYKWALIKFIGVTWDLHNSSSSYLIIASFIEFILLTLSVLTMKTCLRWTLVRIAILIPRSVINIDASRHCFHGILLLYIFLTGTNTRGQLCLWYFLVTSGIITGSLVPACLLGRATFMTQSQAAKGNITVTNYKGMNVIRSKDLKLKASVDILNVVPSE